MDSVNILAALKTKDSNMSKYVRVKRKIFSLKLDVNLSAVLLTFHLRGFFFSHQYLSDEELKTPLRFDLLECEIQDHCTNPQ